MKHAKHLKNKKKSSFKVTLVHLYVVRNSSGYIYEMKGVTAETIKVLSQRFNFT